MNIKPQDLKQKLESKEKIFILDVREPFEYEEWHIPGSVNIPVNEVRERIKEIPKGVKIVTVCLHGVRSEYARRVLESKGIKAESMEGGIAEYISEK